MVVFLEQARAYSYLGSIRYRIGRLFDLFCCLYCYGTPFWGLFFALLVCKKTTIEKQEPRGKLGLTQVSYVVPNLMTNYAL